ncbi:hypothetical protein IWW37_001513 [Coemansia sp. RSA 2050]|nr:hypothetical protein IWW37_001513 [Coemansia sp. RSA 2050]KAJ2734796.1 hypothetical protein IW152_002014 [Coemansia sp. BCRC 34962]
MTDYSIIGASEAQHQLLNEISRELDIDDGDLYAVAQDVLHYVTARLHSQTQGPASCVSYIHSDITQDIRMAIKNEEMSLGMAIDTQAGRLRISSIKFASGQRDAINKQVFYLRKDAKTTGQVFEDIATCLAGFINTHQLGDGVLPLGVNIDRPVAETSRLGGRVADNVDCGLFRNVDIAQALAAAILKQHLPVRVTSVTNCVVSTLVTAQHRFSSTRAALTLNHGINASYYELCENLERFRGLPGSVAVNTELARYGEESKALRLTRWDNRLDRESANTGTHTFEKLVADKYLGEIVRNLITDFMDAQLIFAKDSDASVMGEPYSFFTSYMTTMEDQSDDLSELRDLLRAGFNIKASVVDCQIVRALCQMVTMRAAKLVGAAVAGIVCRASEGQRGGVVVSISGQLTEMNQPYVRCTTETAKRLLSNMGIKEPTTFNVLGEDGYTIGAALAAFSK